MRKIYLLLGSLIVLPFIVVSQNLGITNLWYLGYQSSAGLPYGGITIDFFTGAPIISYTPRLLDLSRCFADISDTNGNMLFYTNGYDVADASDNIMMNGNNISPSNYRLNSPYGFPMPQACLIVPVPGSSSRFYLFHNIFDNPPFYDCALHQYYSEIDMSLNAGSGALTANKNVILINDTLNAGKLIACKHANGIDWWVFCMRQNSNIIYSFLVTQVGISGPYTQHIGSNRIKSNGQVKFNKSGTKFAYFVSNYTTTGFFELFDFDRCTGNFSNPQYVSVTQSNSFVGGVEFSPNDSLLYVSNIDSVYQYQVYATNIAASKIIIASWDSFYSPNPPFATGFSNALTAPDGKIYITTGNGTFHMHVINQPDSLGIACDLQQHSVQLPAYYFNTLPNHPNYFLGCDTTGGCTCLVGLPRLSERGTNSVRAVPNPTNGVFTLQFPVQKTNGELEIYDVMGNLVLKDYIAAWSQYKRVDIMQLANGVYFCRLRWKDATGSVKVIKE